MAETEQKSRIEQQNKIIEIEERNSRSDYRAFKRGQVFAISAVSLIVGLCVYCFYLGYADQGKDIAITVTASLAGIFLFRHAGRIFLKRRLEN